MRRVLLLEIAALGILSVLPGTTPDMLFTTSVAFAAALQMENLREVNGRSYGSTFTTGNLRTVAEESFDWVFEGHSRAAALIVIDFSVIIAAFLLGAIGGGVATREFGNRALWFDIGLLALVLVAIQSGFGLTRPVMAGLKSRAG